MKAAEFLKTWEGISNDDRHATFFRFDTIYKFAEAYHKSEVKKLNAPAVSARSLSEMTTEELKKELAFVDDCNPSNSKQLNTLIDYASKIKAELNVR